MADHDTHDHTGVPGVGGGLATDTLWDTAGDLVLGTGANTAAKLVIGTSGYVLTSNGTTAAWAAAGGVTASSCRSYNSAVQSIADGVVFVALTFDTDEHDDANYHFTSTANLTGTVTKNGTTAIVGSSTLFTSELTVGQMISVPGGGGTERRIVTVITDNTHLTVNSAFANSASGQTVARVNSPFVAVTSGTYGFAASTTWDTNTTNRRIITITKNGTQVTGRQIEQTPIAAGLGMGISLAAIKLAQWDYLEAVVFQNSGGARNAGASGGGGASSAEFVRLGS